MRQTVSGMPITACQQNLLIAVWKRMPGEAPKIGAEAQDRDPQPVLRHFCQQPLLAQLGFRIWALRLEVLQPALLVNNAFLRP